MQESTFRNALFSTMVTYLLSTLRVRGGGCCPSKAASRHSDDVDMHMPGAVHDAPSSKSITSLGDWARAFEVIADDFGRLSEEQKRRVVVNLRRMTLAQADAAARAQKHIEEKAAAMDLVPDAEREPAMHPEVGKSTWDFLSGDQVERLLEHTPLIDLEYIVSLIEAGGVLPAGRQSVPVAALVTASNLWRLKLWNKGRRKGALAVLSFSYPWLDWWHPDRNGDQMHRVLPVLKAMLDEARNDSPHCTIGVMIDFLCLPQKPFASEEDKSRFQVSLRSINGWYYHKNIYTLLITSPPPEGDVYTNVRLHRERGWCFFELAASLVIKKGYCLLDTSMYAGASRFCGKHTIEAKSGCIGQMKAGRQPPISPEIFTEQMRAGVASGQLKFTSNADMALVIGQYETGFVTSINGVAQCEDRMARVLDFMDLGWGDEQAAVLLKALVYAAEHCAFPRGSICVFCSDGNNLSGKMLSRLPPEGHGLDESTVDWVLAGKAAAQTWRGKFFAGSTGD